MITVFAHRDRTERFERFEPAWLQDGSDVVSWVDIEAPTDDDARVLREVFRFHELAVEDALSPLHHPKIERYDDFLFIILHGMAAESGGSRIATDDVDFFLGPRCLVTVHAGAQSVRAVREWCDRTSTALGEGLPALIHRIADHLIDNYEPEISALADRIDTIEDDALSDGGSDIVRPILDVKRDVMALRRVTLPQRDLMSRLARREFVEIDERVAYRFRDVHDHLVRLADESLALQDRITGVLEAHLSLVSNRLNEVMKVLTIIASISIPMTVLTGIYGMNVALPPFPGGADAQFWWVGGMIAGLAVAMLWFFKRRRWF